MPRSVRSSPLLKLYIHDVSWIETPSACIHPRLEALHLMRNVRGGCWDEVISICIECAAMNSCVDHLTQKATLAALHDFPTPPVLFPGSEKGRRNFTKA